MPVEVVNRPLTNWIEKPANESPSVSSEGEPLDSAGTKTNNIPSDAPKLAVAPFDAVQAKKHQIEWAQYLGVQVEYTNSIGMKFILIPPGEFEMGSSPADIQSQLRLFGPNDVHWKECIKSESPTHKVAIAHPFYLGVNEVSQSEYKTVVGSSPSAFSAAGNAKHAVTNTETTDHPVDSVSWSDSIEFTEKLSQLESSTLLGGRNEEPVQRLKSRGYRLPTEAEWEFACRAGTTTRYWIGDADVQLKKIAWCGDNSQGRTHPVGQLTANPFGLYDVHGNVWEWVQDGWSPTSYQANEIEESPEPSALNLLKLIRGGSWDTAAMYRAPSFCLSSRRHAIHPLTRFGVIGFRVALSVEAVQATNANRQPTSNPEKPGAVPAEQVKLHSVYPPAKLRSVQTRPFSQNRPFKTFGVDYEENGVMGIRAHIGGSAWNFAGIKTNQLLRAKVRVRNNSSGLVGVCLTQQGDQHGAQIWISGDQKVILQPSMFAKIKPETWHRTYNVPDVVHPLENWNELVCVLLKDSLLIFVNDQLIDTVDLTTYPISPVTLAFAINASATNTVVEMDEYTLYSIK